MYLAKMIGNETLYINLGIKDSVLLLDDYVGLNPMIYEGEIISLKNLLRVIETSIYDTIIIEDLSIFSFYGGTRMKVEELKIIIESINNIERTIILTFRHTGNRLTEGTLFARENELFDSLDGSFIVMEPTRFGMCKITNVEDE